MRRLMLTGAAGLLLTLGAIGAANAENPNVPSFSPYAIMAYDSGPAPTAAPVEHRSAAVAAAYGDAALPNGNVPSFSPYVLVPEAK